MKGHFVTGSVEGTGAVINVELGFTPKTVRLINIDDADGLDPVLDWNDQMADASGLLHLKTVDSGTTGNAGLDLITTGGITPYAGASGSASKGFTIGTNANVNASGETIVYEAWGPND